MVQIALASIWSAWHAFTQLTLSTELSARIISWTPLCCSNWIIFLQFVTNNWSKFGLMLHHQLNFVI